MAASRSPPKKRSSAALNAGSVGAAAANSVMLDRNFMSSGWPRIARALSRGRKVDETVNRVTGRKVVIRAAHSTPRQVDGDPVSAGHELICECLAGKLLVRVPR